MKIQKSVDKSRNFIWKLKTTRFFRRDAVFGEHIFGCFELQKIHKRILLQTKFFYKINDNLFKNKLINN